MPSELVLFRFRGVILGIIKSWCSAANSTRMITTEQSLMCGQTISLVKDIGDALSGTYSEPSFVAVEAAMAHILLVKNFHQHRMCACVVARQMVTPEHVNAVDLSGLRHRAPCSFVLPD